MFVTPTVLCLTLLATPAAETKQAVEQTATQALASVPCDSAFVFTEITSQGVEPLFGIRADEELAIGSSFKLFILGTLIEEVNADRRQLCDTMRLEQMYHGPPHSELADWPLRMPVTLNTLALKMISISDNTATDHLHHLLGRKNIEQQMATMGHSHPRVNIPLLSTREMTILRNKKLGEPGEKYLKLDEAGRRAMLKKLTADLPDYSDKGLDFDTASYKMAEWYASPLDMAHALAWIQKHTEMDAPAAGVRDVLTVDTKLKFDPAIWKFAGFKGGSEDQLMAGNWLLQHRNGRWYTFHVFFNNPDGPVTPQQIGPVIEKILGAVEMTLK